MELFWILKSLYNELDTKRKNLLFLVIFLSVLGAIAEVLSLGALIPFLMSLTNQELKLDFLPIVISKQLEVYQISLIKFYAVIFIFFTLLSVLVRTFLIYMQLKIGNSIGHYLSVKAFSTAVRYDYENHLLRRPSEVVSTLTVKMYHIVGTLITPTTFIFSNSIILLSVFFLLVYLYGASIFPIFCMIFVTYLAIVYWSKSRLSENSIIVSSRTDRMVSVVQEALTGFKELMIFKLQKDNINKFIGADADLRKAFVNSNLLAQTPRYFLEGVTTICFVVTIIYLHSINKDMLDLIPFLGVIALAVQRMLPLAQTVFSNYATIRSSMASLSDIDLVFKDDKKRKKIKNNQSKSLQFKKTLSLEAVKYSYPGQKQEILKGIDLKISKGQVVGLFGETAGGKSTVLDIVAGLLKPTYGNIVLDGKQIVLSEYSSWFDIVAVVSQNPFLLDTSIEQNITLSDNLGQKEKLRLHNAVKHSNLEKDLAKLPDGIKTKVGHNGVGLSGGQRQRVALARAIFRSYDILILDEATSALDTATEKKIIDNLNCLENRPTIIMVAHRVNTLKNCDKLYEIKNGLVARSGTYSELLG